MNRYFFDLEIGNETGEDDEGLMLRDLEAVQKGALRILADAAQPLLIIPPDMSVRVRDEAGAVMRVLVVFEIDRTN